jgi:hypothetical protein
VRPIAAVVAVAAFVALPTHALGFRNAQPGTAIPDRTMPTADGQRATLLAPGKVNVFVFLRTGQEFSEIALHHLATLEREFEKKPVRFVAVFSDGDPAGDALRLVREAGARMPVLVDQGDALYGDLGVAMAPSAGIVARDGRLAAFQAFRKVNYLDAMRAQVQVVLGELDQAGLAAVLDPGVPIQTGAGRAHARLTLARRLLVAGSVDAAIESARASVALDPGMAEAHQVLSESLAQGGKCDEARREAAEARRLAPSAKAPSLLACRR